MRRPERKNGPTRREGHVSFYPRAARGVQGRDGSARATVVGSRCSSEPSCPLPPPDLGARRVSGLSATSQNCLPGPVR